LANVLDIQEDARDPGRHGCPPLDQRKTPVRWAFPSRLTPRQFSDNRNPVYGVCGLARPVGPSGVAKNPTVWRMPGSKKPTAEEWPQSNHWIGGRPAASQRSRAEAGGITSSTLPAIMRTRFPANRCA